MKHVLFFLSLTIFTLVFTGCDAQRRAQMGPLEGNLLGIIKAESESYASTGPTTFAISTEELSSRKNFSGEKTTFLWGLITLKDY